MITNTIEQYNINDADYILQCKHCVSGKSVVFYEMKSKLLGITKSGKIKILVFGDRYWKNKDNVKKIRYVDKNRLIQLQKD